MPKTRKRSRAAANSSPADTGDVANVLLRLLPTESVNSFQPTAFHSYPICVRMLLKLGTGNGERGTGNGERGTGNECTAVIHLRIQNGGGNDVYKPRF